MDTIEALIKEKIHEFDLFSLLKTLGYAGYRIDDILFKSHSSICSQRGLIQDIRFLTRPHRHAVILLNFGLLAAQTPLPSYYLKKMAEDNFDISSFEDFIGFFDHQLIKNYIFNLYPEMNPELFPDWEKEKRWYLGMLDLKSNGTFHWLFEIVFPELSVQVDKTSPNREVMTVSPRLGYSILGENAVFGRKVKVSVSGCRITLLSENEFTNTGETWPNEIHRRLNTQIFPLLRPVGVDLEILLVIMSQKRWAKLHSESYLGYDRMRGGEARYRRIKIFKGHLSEVDGPEGKGITYGY